MFTQSIKGDGGAKEAGSSTEHKGDEKHSVDKFIAYPAPHNRTHLDNVC
jgi:hypothetical protein